MCSYAKYIDTSAVTGLLPLKLLDRIFLSGNNFNMLSAGVRVVYWMITEERILINLTKPFHRFCSLKQISQQPAGTFLFDFGDNTCHYSPQ